jgi:hypothetical protein
MTKNSARTMQNLGLVRIIINLLSSNHKLCILNIILMNFNFTTYLFKFLISL